MKRSSASKITRSIYYVITLCLSMAITNGCQDNDDDDNINPPIEKISVQGHVQKGPFIIGTTISMSELDASLDQTGSNFSTQTSDNSGYFEVSNISLTSNY